MYIDINWNLHIHAMLDKKKYLTMCELRKPRWQYIYPVLLERYHLFTIIQMYDAFKTIKPITKRYNDV